MLDRQINCYSVDTGNFYTNHERRLHWRNKQFRSERSYLYNKIKRLTAQLERKRHTVELGDNDVVTTALSLYRQSKCEGLDSKFVKQAERQLDELIQEYNLDLEVLLVEDKEADIAAMQEAIDELTAIKEHKVAGAIKTKRELKQLIENRVNQNIKSGGRDHVRVLDESRLTPANVISVFESTLNRTIGAKTNELTDDLVTVQIYYYELFRDLEYFGFMFKGEHYIYFSSSAGQIRTKKAVFIKESTWLKHQRTIMCGLTFDTINAKGGMNVNKLLAYLALQNSATDIWDGFNIDKAIVVDDFETEVDGTFDFIDDVTYEIKRTTGRAAITHTDGAGMMLPRLGNNRMIRAPWIKGLLGAFDFRRFIIEHNGNPKIKDIYGAEHDVIAEDIEVIFTKSQFKLWKYYDSWDQYKEYFHRYGCTVSYCNMEQDAIQDNRVSYQMLQSLTDYTEEEFDIMVAKSVSRLDGLSSSVKNMQAAFGVNPYNQELTPFQEAIKIYPDLLNDEFAKATLREIKDSLVKSYWSGKLDVRGKYTFVLPDFYAACQHWFLGEAEPEGLLKDGEVYTNLFRYDERLDCLRSPHLYQEHAVRYNLAYKGCGERMERAKAWFNTNAIYTSCHDMISRILQFDVDGDMLLVVADENFVRVAERNMNGIVPLYYEMKKAGAQLITKESIYDGLISAFTHSNIGIYSNSISKIKNSPEFLGANKEEALRAIKLLTAENNYCIDAAKTLYMPVRPKEDQALLSRYTSVKLPHFFKYAKGKGDSQVLPPNNSIVNRLASRITNPRINTRRAGLGKIDYRLMMSDPEIAVDPLVVAEYKKLNSEYHFKINLTGNNLSYLNSYILNDLEQFGYDEVQLSDMLVKQLYGIENTPRKHVLWSVFGEVIVQNLKNNMEIPFVRLCKCVDCLEYFEINNEHNRSSIRCPRCQKAYRNLQYAIRNRNTKLGALIADAYIDKETLDRVQACNGVFTEGKCFYLKTPKILNCQ